MQELKLFTLDEAGEFQEDVKNSRFICMVKPVASVEEAMDFIRENSDPAARHNCWAWKVGNDYRFNDDGEPSGTAGRPILNAIEYAELTNVAALVLRWFGGIKLGTGGLCRAYGGVTSNCLKQLAISEIKEMTELELMVPFEFSNTAYQLISKELLEKSFEEYESEGLRQKLVLEKKNLQRLKDHFTEISRGQIIFPRSK